MIFDEDDLDNLQKTGSKVYAAGGSSLKPIRSSPDIGWTLRRLIDVLNDLPDRIVEIMKHQQPKVVEVTPILPPYPEPEKRPREWKFTHTRDANGKIIETIAKAID